MATDPARLTTPERTSEDADSALRPKSLDEFVGQQGAQLGQSVIDAVADAANDAADLDLYVYRYNAAGTALVALAGQSATGSADEMVTLQNPVAAKYLVVVDGYSAAPGESAIQTTSTKCQ